MGLPPLYSISFSLLSEYGVWTHVKENLQPCQQLCAAAYAAFKRNHNFKNFKPSSVRISMFIGLAASLTFELHPPELDVREKWLLCEHGLQGGGRMYL